jgi:threonylcarbamoyladenosine tRNA methylthiotransferase MtaB
VSDTRGAGAAAGHAGPPLRVHAAVAGCKVSRADGEAALALLAAGGCQTVADPAQADVQVVLTCGVTAEAERSSRKLARRLAAHGRPVVVAGCAAALRPGQFAGAAFDLVSRDGVAAGPDEVARRVLEAGRRGAAGVAGRPAALDDGGGRTVPIDHLAATLDGDAMGSPAVAIAPAHTGLPPRDRTRFTLKVQDGCAGRCAYCAVRLVRGRPRSLPAAAALERAGAALAGGCGEVVVSGIDVGAYRDPASGDDLAALVRRLVALPGLQRLRLSSIEPGHLSDALLDALADERVARHLHVPLQSADDGVLGAMGRPYTRRDYDAAIARARRRLPGVALSTDLIAGYPAEDEAAFARSLAAAGPAGPFSRVHVFGYSARSGTPAAALAPLAPATVKERVRRARAAAAGAQGAANAAPRRLAVEVLVEECRDGYARGYSSTYVRYYLSGTAARGRLVRAVGDEPYRDGLRGRIV